MKRQRISGLLSGLFLGFLSWTFFPDLVAVWPVLAWIAFFFVIGVIQHHFNLNWASSIFSTVLSTILLNFLIKGIFRLLTFGEPTPLDTFFPLWDRAMLLSLAQGVFFWIGFRAVEKKPELSKWRHLLHISLALLLFFFQKIAFAPFWTHPLLPLFLVFAFIFWELDQLYRDQNEIRHWRPLVGGLFFLPLALFTGYLSFNQYQKNSSSEGAGLIQPTLFGFDFAPIIKLESEIKLDDDLVMIYRREGYPRDQMLRRQVLSGYDSEKGFFWNEQAPEDDEVPWNLGSSELVMEPAPSLTRTEVQQEVYLVNLDPSLVFALNQPVRAIPLTGWDMNKFRGAYRVTSQVLESSVWTISDSPGKLTAEAYAYYTNYGDDEKIAGLAKEITQGLSDSNAITKRILVYLLENFFYSLKPGVAVNQPPLHHFLFQAKKGYCSYFAFSMVLMLRSLGIPSRVAVGFLVDKNSEVLSFYPIKSFQAHAWVEVLSLENGWVTFDPTSATLAPGEDWNLNASADDAFLSMVEDILGAHLTEIQTNEVESIADSHSERWWPSSTDLVIFLFITFILAAIFWKFRRYLWLMFIRPERLRIIALYKWVRDYLQLSLSNDASRLTPNEIFHIIPSPELKIITTFYEMALYSRELPTSAFIESQAAHRMILSRRTHRPSFWRLLWF